MHVRCGKCLSLAFRGSAGRVGIGLVSVGRAGTTLAAVSILREDSRLRGSQSKGEMCPPIFFGEAAFGGASSCIRPSAEGRNRQFGPPSRRHSFGPHVRCCSNGLELLRRRRPQRVQMPSAVWMGLGRLIEHEASFGCTGRSCRPPAPFQTHSGSGDHSLEIPALEVPVSVQVAGEHREDKGSGLGGCGAAPVNRELAADRELLFHPLRGDVRPHDAPQGAFAGDRALAWPPTPRSRSCC
jgi:hypothetical protein